jgi:hypothetical protein
MSLKKQNRKCVVRSLEDEEVLMNRTSSQPRFLLGKLEAKRSYTINIYSYNAKVPAL